MARKIPRIQLASYNAMQKQYIDINLNIKFNTSKIASWIVGISLIGLMIPKKSVLWLSLTSLALMLVAGLTILQNHPSQAKRIKFTTNKWEWRDNQWLLIITILPIAYITKMATSGTNYLMLINVLHLLFTIPIYWSVRRTGLSPAAVILGASTAPIIAAVLTAPQVLMGAERVELPAIPNPIPLGNFSLLLGAIGGLLWIFRYEIKLSKLHLAWTATGVLSAVWVTAASGTRSSWLAVPIIAWIYSLAFKSWKNKERWRLLVLSTILTAACAASIPNIKQRLNIGQNEISQYFNRKNQWKEGTPLGSMDRRLEMWRIGTLAFSEAPWWGLGFEEFEKFVEKQIEKKTTHPDLMMHDASSRHQHLHNEIITTAARLGLAGLAALLYLWIGAWRWLDRKNNGQTTTSARIFKLIGLLTHSSVIVFSLTDSIFGMTINTMIYAMLLGISAGGLRNSEFNREESSFKQRPSMESNAKNAW